MFFRVRNKIHFSICTVFLCLLVLFFPLPSYADTPVTVATWNTAFIDRSVSDLDLQGFVEEVDFDILLVNEIKTQDDLDHLKSSRGASGASDRENAQKRELVAAAAARHIVQLREDNPDYSVLFGGDLNVGVSDDDKNGNNLEDDRTDGYDDTHAILSAGIIDGLRMRSLAKNLGSTFVGRDGIPDFPQAGAIDALYVDGPLADQFKDAQATSSSFGSDHLAVFTTTGDLVVDDAGNIAADSIQITNALPNPSGSDAGNEAVTLTYTGSDIADISGWKLQDKSRRTYTFPSGTQLNSGDNEIKLLINSMPLNNSGDTITLLNRAGVQFGDIFEYSASDVQAGVPVR